MLRHYSNKQKVKMILNILIYVIFAYLVVVAALKDHSTSGYIFIVFGGVALILGLLNEYLKALYNEALWYLNFKLDIDKAKELYDKMVSYDLFNIHQKERGMFDVLVALQEEKPKKVLELISKDEKKFSATPELYLIKTYLQMRAYLLMNKREKINELYADVVNIKNMKKSPKVFQYDEFEAIRFLAMKDYKQAYKYLSNINMQRMNYRERSFILKQLILTAPEKDKEIYKEKYDFLMELVNESK